MIISSCHRYKKKIILFQVQDVFYPQSTSQHEQPLSKAQSHMWLVAAYRQCKSGG